MRASETNKSNARLKELMSLYFAQNIHDGDKQELWDYINDPMFSQEVKRLIPDATDEPLPHYTLGEEKQHQILTYILREQEEIEVDNEIKTLPGRLKRIGWRKLSIAASIVAVLSIAGLALINIKSSGESNQPTVVQEIPAGTNGATLRLADGRIINLEEAGNGEIAQEAGIKIEKGSDGELIYRMDTKTSATDQINVLTTARGQMYSIVLPDGSKVWMNSDSELEYMANLVTEGKRVVKLRGEAYFEISKDKSHPFIVNTKGQDVEVLGTQFNVNAYENEPFISTTLLEGSISLRTATEQRLLSPGQQALNKQGQLQVRQANIENITDWKEGDFAFKNVDFKTALRKIERWYNVEMIYDKSLPKDLQAGGWISRKKNLSSVLEFIESAKMVRFKADGNKIYVMPY
ncbi:FecR family protein [Sphingobacterium psychroaquaticum]|uniref:FecR family protein n=1 Tax=Sphingobacterium psychroaquaticum TaxID=561061 RepID=A0A1X7ID23_9SPHI|nr:FecR family protein [Sphingobacterium psychroaquaticum]SMG12346.1 FecR family protein [Sphingobacterium psychroaquaticum]